MGHPMYHETLMKNVKNMDQTKLHSSIVNVQDAQSLKIRLINVILKILVKSEDVAHCNL